MNYISILGNIATVHAGANAEEHSVRAVVGGKRYEGVVRLPMLVNGVHKFIKALYVMS